ncbi:hypothetical protein PC117_g13471 [Phytophthora cactorum]|nr:hypothetical protein PC117_g13471 [Phytophthora cactorum]
MLARYVKIRDAIKMVAAVEDLLPRASIHRQVVQLVNKLEALDSVCVKLQSKERTLADVRLLSTLSWRSIQRLLIISAPLLGLFTRQC